MKAEEISEILSKTNFIQSLHRLFSSSDLESGSVINVMFSKSENYCKSIYISGKAY
jgi:hypothetical protein